MTDEATQLQLVLDALTAANAFPYTLDAVKRQVTPPKRYTEVSVVRRFGGTPRVAGGSSVTGWRILTRAVALTEDDAREVRRRYFAALEDVALGDGTPIEFESGDPIAGDDGWSSGLDTWTYAT